MNRDERREQLAPISDAIADVQCQHTRHYAMCAPCAADSIRPLVTLLAEERDLAIAHDRQPYPTQWAYDQAVTALEEHRQRADKAESALANVRTYCLGAQSYCSDSRIDPPPWVAAILDSIDCLAQSPLPPGAPVSTSPEGGVPAPAPSVVVGPGRPAARDHICANPECGHSRAAHDLTRDRKTRTRCSHITGPEGTPCPCTSYQPPAVEGTPA